MNTLEITATRYALVDGLPFVEGITFRYAPDDARSRPQPFHENLGLTVIGVVDPETGVSAESPAPNLWFCLSFSLPTGVPLFEIPTGTPHPAGGTEFPDDSDYWDPYSLPLRVGVTVITQTAYETAVADLNTQNEAATAQATADWFTSKQAAWDAKLSRYTLIGWEEADVIAEFGSRPVG